MTFNMIPNEVISLIPILRVQYYSNMTFQMIPNEVISLILGKLGGVSVIKCSKVCQRWEEIVTNLEDKVWKVICHRDIESDTLTEILKKTSLKLKLIKWRQIYRSWFVSTYNPEKWVLNKKISRLEKRDFVYRIQISKGKIILFTSFTLEMYSLETRELLAIHEGYPLIWLIKILEIGDGSYCILPYHTESIISLKILRMEKNKFKILPNCELRTEFEAIDWSIRTIYQSYIGVYLNSTKRIIILRAEEDPLIQDLITLKLVAHLGIEYRCFDLWDNHLILSTKDHVKFFSLENFELFSNPTFELKVNKWHTIVIANSNSIIFYCGASIFEVKKQDNKYDHVNYKTSNNITFDYAKVSTQIFSNILFYYTSLNQPLEFYNTSNLVNQIKNKRYNYNGCFRNKFDICLNGNNLVIVQVEDTKSIKIYTYNRPISNI